jgi:hypothetical protein
MFPHVEPIPLPAPVWLFKSLELLTVTLHFLAVQLFVGMLLVGTVWALVGRWRKRPIVTDAAGIVANRLPIVMVYVINLGVPPLLFAQVLYGRAIYASSILIGVAWISVIFLLMLVYGLLYVSSGRAAAGKGWGWYGLVSLAGTGLIALIYTSNMTLMMRPDTWVAMYHADPLGLHLNTGDPTVWPRWLFMILGGGLCTGGAGLMLLGMNRVLSIETTRFLRAWGSRLAAVGIVLQAVLGYWVVVAQPAEVKVALTEHPIYGACLPVWLLLAALVLGVALVAHARAALPSWFWTGPLGLLVFLEVAVMAVTRSGLRDLALLQHGLDVWDRQVTTNWAVVGLFLVTFVCGLLTLGWLGRVVARARRVEERYV